MEPRCLSSSLLGGRISRTQIGALEELESTGLFANLKESLLNEEEKWINMVDLPNAETAVPEPWFDGDDISVKKPIARILKKIIIIKVLRSDRLLVAVNELLETVLVDKNTVRTV